MALAQNYVHFQVERSKGEATERRNAASDDSPYSYFGLSSALQTCKCLLQLRGMGRIGHHSFADGCTQTTLVRCMWPTWTASTDFSPGRERFRTQFVLGP